MNHLDGDMLTECQTPTHDKVVGAAAEEPDIEEVHDVDEVTQAARDTHRYLSQGTSRADHHRVTHSAWRKERKQIVTRGADFSYCPILSMFVDCLPKRK